MFILLSFKRYLSVSRERDSSVDKKSGKFSFTMKTLGPEFKFPQNSLVRHSMPVIAAVVRRHAELVRFLFPWACASSSLTES